LAGEAKVILLTAAGFRGDAARFGQFSVCGHLTKPFNDADLLEAIGLAWPSEVEEKPLVTSQPSGPAVAAQSLNLLLAEDNRVNQKVAIALLEKRGHRVSVANNGREALAALARATFDAILMDIQMPEMDGLQATAAIRAEEQATGRRTPVLAMTAHAMEEDRQRCLAAGMDGYISKPIDAASLENLLSIHCAPQLQRSQD
jgi:two-component system, sensor histidine kinase and response regulator